MNPSARVSFCAGALLHPIFAMSSKGFCWGSLRCESRFLMLLDLHRFSELVLGLFLQKGVDQILQILVRWWDLLVDEVVVVQFPDASEF